MQLRFAGIESAAMRVNQRGTYQSLRDKVKPGQNYKSKSGTWAKAS